MGVSIHYTLGMENETQLEKILLFLKDLAEKQRWEISYFELSDQEKTLIVLPDEHSESINLEFHKWQEIESYKNYQPKPNDDLRNPQIYLAWRLKHTYDRLKDLKDELKYMWICDSWTKTQFAGSECHKKVAEFIRLIAKFCSFVKIHDEGNYYETRDIQEAEKHIDSCGKLIDRICGELQNLGWEIKKGD